MTATESVSNRLNWLLVLSVGVFALHNSEEWVNLTNFRMGGLTAPLQDLFTKTNFGAAVLLLTLCYATLIIFIIMWPRKKLLILTLISFNAIFVNAALHILSIFMPIITIPYAPYTSLLLILPLGIAINSAIVKSKKISISGLSWVIMLGGLLQFPMAFIALKAAEQLIGF
uniref:HXXEE domain-containing protein n=1 Tax=OCS116 cluster bacterium TaxID=2030921 RepID=A0A2A4Z7K6_9PROT